jgi:hypothetical protein
MLAIAAGLAAVVTSPLAAQAVPPQMRYSTHDQTLPILGGGGEPVPGGDFFEWAVDAKSPGDGRTYTVSTITVREVLPGSLYSNFLTAPATGLGVFVLPAPLQRQITILQITDATQAIVAQKYFYGLTGSSADPDYSRATNARAISAWPAVDGGTRVAICGETFDERLPNSQSPGWPAATGLASSGFVAVFDGVANLQWTYHLFGASGSESSIVTDVSIRTEMVGSVLYDVVTYCGISSHGNPATNGSMTTIAPFVAPPGVPGCTAPAAGDTDNGAGQWDGFVGRVRRPVGGGAIQSVFHSVVGGVQQDGLFGLAEIDADRFLVVGSTGVTGSVGAGGASFPFLSLPGSVCLVGTPLSYTMGVMMVFDASTVAGGNLTLESTQWYGAIQRVGSGSSVVLIETRTVLRDVMVQPGYLGGLPHCVAVGSTNDSIFFDQFIGLVAAPQATFGGGGSDGLIVTSWITPGGQTTIAGSYRGGEGSQFLTGVGGWNEFTDQFVVTGVLEGPTVRQIDIGNYYVDTSQGSLYKSLAGMQNVEVGGSGSDYPTAIGTANGSSSFAEFGLGNPSGGGIAVDEEARVTVVGTTASSNYPAPTGRPKTGLVNDAVRSVFHMLPPNSGRTDGTYSGIGAPPVTFPLAGFPGGTTPQCALTPFGSQVGLAPAQLPRMQIDLEVPPAPPPAIPGVPSAGNPIALVVSRPPVASAPPITGQVSGWQIDFPGSGPGPTLLPNGVVLWMTNSPAFLVHVSGPEATLRAQWTLPAGSSATVSVQLGCGLPTMTTYAGCTVATDFVASPALWFTF